MGKKAKDEASKPKKDKDKKKVIAKAAEAPVAEAPKKQEPKKAKAPLTPEEEARRQWQRECREKALAARSSGEGYVAARKVKQKKRPTLAQRKFERRQEARPSKAERNAERREQQKAAKIEKAKAPTVVIVPIFWKGEAQQMAVVLSVCADVQTALEASGVRCELDAGKKVCRSAAPTPQQQRSAWPDPLTRSGRFASGQYTPGQKFAYWEHKGVKLRVEVGPREAQRGRCTLAKTFQAGVPARRVTGAEVGGSLAGRLAELAAMSVEGFEEGFEMETSGGQAPATGDGGGEVEAASGGDDLEGNLEAPVADEEAEDEAPKKKKKKRKEAAEPTALQAESDAGKEPQAAAKPKKKPKVVVF